ncbi:MAG: sulfatase [Pirellulales bacterium]|nr:sulfatase [Pirellulales bacterium]
MYRLRSYLLAAFVILSFAATLALGEAAKKDKPARPNIIFIMSDDHASHAISSYGSRINKTPNIDRLAKGGIRFSNCFCTNSICGPSRAVILTGKYSHLNGFATNRHSFNGAQQTVAKLLQKAGYQTAMIGKWHLRTDPTGFDYWNVLPGQGNYYNPKLIEMGKPSVHQGYVTDIITDIAIGFLERRDSDRPFFLMCHNKAPHREWLPSPKYLTKYDDVDLPEPPTLFDDYATRGTPAHEQEMTIDRHLRPVEDLKLDPLPGKDGKPAKTPGFKLRFTPRQLARWEAAYGPKNEAFRKANLSGKDLLRWKYQRYMKDYLRCIASVDENVGRLLDYLDKHGLADNTIVFYTSDQGFYLGDHGWFDKRFMYEESYRMPLLVRWPAKIKAGTVSDALVSNLDFAETFLAAAGTPIPEDMQGRSFLPILEGKTPDDWRKALYYRYYEYPAVHMVHKHYGVRTDRYKLIYFHDLNEWELYDLQKDPHELNNVYADPAYAKQVKELKATLAKLKKQYKDNDNVADWKTRT